MSLNSNLLTHSYRGSEVYKFVHFMLTLQLLKHTWLCVTIYETFRKVDRVRVNRFCVLFIFNITLKIIMLFTETVSVAKMLPWHRLGETEVTHKISELG